jgi:peptide/nickel transport system permease protein
MSVTEALSPPLTSARAEPRFGVLRRLQRNRVAIVGIAFVLFVAALALLAPFLPIGNPNKIDLGERLRGVGASGHLLGTDGLGRDMLARLIWGARVSLAVGILATAFAATVGSAIGLAAGFFRRLDTPLMRGIDVLMAFPYLLFALALVAFLGPGLFKAMIAIAVVNVPFFARAVRGATLSVASSEYVKAASILGLSRLRVLAEEVVPNVTFTILVTASTTVGWMITETAGLSFLGLGAQPPTADWGTMLGDGRNVLSLAPHVTIVPGLAIFLVVISLNFVGDGLRDALDPRLK